MLKMGMKTKYIRLIRNHNITVNHCPRPIWNYLRVLSETTGQNTKQTEETWVLIPFRPPSVLSGRIY